MKNDALKTASPPSDWVGVGFSTSNWPLSWLIRKVTGSRFSHCWIYLVRGGKPFVLEAGFHGVVETPWEGWWRGKVNIEVVRPHVDLSEAMKTAQVWIGEAYDYDALAGEGWVVIGRWFHKKWKNPFYSPKEMFCAELVAAILKLASYPGTVDMVPGNQEPADVRKLLGNDPTVKLDTGH